MAGLHLNVLIVTIILFKDVYCECDMTTINTCISNKYFGFQLTNDLKVDLTATTGIIGIKAAMCGGGEHDLNGEKFAAIAECATEQPDCDQELFHGENPAAIVETEDYSLLKGTKSQKLATSFEMICDDTCTKLFDGSTPPQVDTNQLLQGCMGDIGALFAAMFTGGNTEEVCKPMNSFFNCMMKASIAMSGYVFDCQTMVRNLDTDAMANLVDNSLTSSVNAAGSGEDQSSAVFDIFEQCNLEPKSIVESYMAEIQGSSTDNVRASIITMLAALLVIIFIQ